MKRKSINVKLTLRLKEEEKQTLKALLSKGKESVRVIRRARALELFDKGCTSPQIAESVGVTPETARRIGWNYVNQGLNKALYDSPRPGVAKRISDNEKTRIVALVCSDPPEGFNRWSIRLITVEVLKRKIVKKISREAIRLILKSHGIKPWREKNVVYSRVK
jgi:putative transposase